MAAWPPSWRPEGIHYAIICGRPGCYATILWKSATFTPPISRRGANVITTASFQATLQGFIKAGNKEQDGILLLRRSVTLGSRSRKRNNRTSCGWCPVPTEPIWPTVPSTQESMTWTWEGLVEFHRRRWQILAAAQPDIMLCETIPSAIEIEAIIRLAEETESPPVWISFSCRNDKQISDGTELVVCVQRLESIESVVGIGVNCFPPQWASGLIRRIRQNTDKQVIVFPNSGEQFDIRTRDWCGTSDVQDFAEQALTWQSLGANVIGGCCRVTPQQIGQLRQRLG